MATAAAGQGPAFRVLDAGAGEAPYRDLLAHVSYETVDFAQVDEPYAPDLDYVSDLTAIPVEDSRYDLVVCSQVLEHLPDPVAALGEFRRIVKPDGQVWLSAPLFYEEHEQPFDVHRYTQFAWRHMATQAAFEVRSLAPLEGYYTTLAYQLTMAARELPRWMLPLRAFFALLAGGFARLDLPRPATERGMCKNLRVVLQPSLTPAR